MDELVDILNEKGQKTGETCMKSEAHKNGIFHASVHIWIYNNYGDILIQKRAKNKDTHPSYWDVSVAGHIGAGEVPEDSAVREIKEEIGLQIKNTDLEQIGFFKSVFIHRKDLKDMEYHYTYLCKNKLDMNKLTVQIEEVAELKILSLTDFEKKINKPNNNLLFVPYDKEYYPFIINQIKKRVNI